MVSGMSGGDPDVRLAVARELAAKAATNDDGEPLEGVVRAFAVRVETLQREMANLRAELESLGQGRAAS